MTPHVYPNSLWLGRVIEVCEGLKPIGELTIEKIKNQVLVGSAETYTPVWVESVAIKQIEN